LRFEETSLQVFQRVNVVGAGLAGSEAALVLARAGIAVRLIEQKPDAKTPAQVLDGPAELVCSNSFRSNNPINAVGLIKEELRLLDSPLMALAEEHRVAAGDALAVDRDAFSEGVGRALEAEPLIELEARCIESWDEDPDNPWILATGPLTADGLAQRLQQELGPSCAFYDSIAPIVEADSLDLSVIYALSRYGKGDGADYLNIPLSKDQYEVFIDAVLAAPKVTPHSFEKAKYFEGCLPLEEVAKRGRESLRFGAMKPVGLPNPSTGREPYAVVQLRSENQGRTAFNMVGFQTRMSWGAQTEVLRSLPGMAQAKFLRLGVVHRNTYVDAPRVLNDQLALHNHPHVHLAGQITGCEGYVESLSVGHMMALLLVRQGRGLSWQAPPLSTALGALWGHLRGAMRAKGMPHEPNNIHWGLVQPLQERLPKKIRKQRRVDVARQEFSAWAAAGSASGAGEPLHFQAETEPQTGSEITL
jgi:methylenetetrahydrofolate--tRNA-(uracil-5-)-methyltransferase